MHRLKLQSISLAVMLAFPVAAGAQQGLKLKSQPTLVLIPPGQKEDVPVFLEADTLRGHSEMETEAEGDARLRKRGQAMFADWMRYDKPTDDVTAEGNVRIEQGTDVVEGTRLKFNLETEYGFMEDSRYSLHRDPKPIGQRQPFEPTDGRGTAEMLLFEGPKKYRAEHANYTTCGPGNDDWYVRAEEFQIDKSRNVGTARDASIIFMDVPIFYSPYLTFSLHQERKSGFLSPHYGSTSTGGAEFTLPYYWNIAPNMDATFSPRVITRRGVQLNTEFRYLEPTYKGDAHLEVLPDDRAFGGDDRHAYFVNHRQVLPYGWVALLNLQRVSDNNYFTDLSTKVALTSQVQLPNEATLSRGGTWAGGLGVYSLSASVQRWQTLQVDPLVPVTAPYNRQPQLTFTATRPDVLHTDFDFQGEFVSFDHPTLVTGKRLIAYPSLSVPLETSYAFVKPKVGVSMTRYSIDPNASGFQDDNRTLPIASVDSGLIFERQMNLFGTRYLQTLEPRMYYVYIPFRDQSRLPVFDTGQQDINFTTIYSENQFAGGDRINDANQITIGVSSRFLSPETGSERLRVGVAQRYYFSTQQVTLPGVPVRTSSSSDLLAALSGAVAPHWTAEAGWQYSTDFSQTQKFNVGTRYQPAPGKVLNLSYRETINSIRQFDISAQWPVREGWTGLGRYNYSLQDKRLLEALAGIEYNGDCWAIRVVAHRFATTSSQTSTTFFVQLELNGISRIGSSPLETLRRNIGGFVRDPRAPTPQELRGTAFTDYAPVR
ncbi:MAG TPA: LPS-assembly protein LptD [Burkholderiales bacterium]|nr:LPS-assembly protein LptD [Burkholderiales bacterium]